MTARTETLPARLNPSQLPDPRRFGYSVAAVTPAAGRLAFVSGQVGMGPDGAIPPAFEAQAALAFENLAAVLAALGAGPERVAKLTVYVVDHRPEKLGPLSAAVLAMFGETPPAQTLVGVAALALPGLLFEVEAVVQLD